MKINFKKVNNEIDNLKSYLKSDPTLFPFSGSPGSGHKLEAVLIPPSFTETIGKQEKKEAKHVWLGNQEWYSFQIVHKIYSCILLF